MFIFQLIIFRHLIAKLFKNKILVQNFEQLIIGFLFIDFFMLLYDYDNKTIYLWIHQIIIENTKLYNQISNHTKLNKSTIMNTNQIYTNDISLLNAKISEIFKIILLIFNFIIICKYIFNIQNYNKRIFNSKSFEPYKLYPHFNIIYSCYTSLIIWFFYCKFNLFETYYVYLIIQSSLLFLSILDLYLYKKYLIGIGSLVATNLNYIHDTFFIQLYLPDLNHFTLMDKMSNNFKNSNVKSQLNIVISDTNTSNSEDESIKSSSKSDNDISDINEIKNKKFKFETIPLKKTKSSNEKWIKSIDKNSKYKNIFISYDRINWYETICYKTTNDGMYFAIIKDVNLLFHKKLEHKNIIYYSLAYGVNYQHSGKTLLSKSQKELIYKILTHINMYAKPRINTIYIENDNSNLKLIYFLDLLNKHVHFITGLHINIYFSINNFTEMFTLITLMLNTLDNLIRKNLYYAVKYYIYIENGIVQDQYFKDVLLYCIRTKNDHYPVSNISCLNGGQCNESKIKYSIYDVPTSTSKDIVDSITFLNTKPKSQKTNICYSLSGEISYIQLTI